MSDEELRNALIRLLVIEHQNGKSKVLSRLGRAEPASMLSLSKQRFRLACEFLARGGAVSSMLFKRRLPGGKDWPGTTRLVSAPIFKWVDDVWTHIGCTLPFDHRIKPPGHAPRTAGNLLPDALI